MQWRRRLKSNSSEDQTLLPKTRTRHGSHFLRAFFAGRRISPPSKPMYLRQVERNPLIPAQRFGEQQPTGDPGDFCIALRESRPHGCTSLFLRDWNRSLRASLPKTSQLVVAGTARNPCVWPLLSLYWPTIAPPGLIPIAIVRTALNGAVLGTSSVIGADPSGSCTNPC